MENPAVTRTRNSGDGGNGITSIDDNVLQNIVSKLGAKDIASAACVNHTWHSVSTTILSRPHFISFLSFNLSLPEAVKELTCKVFSAPIRPQFAILTIPPHFNLDAAHDLLVEELGYTIPYITCAASGVIGRNAFTNLFSEVKFPQVDEDFLHPSTGGVSLTVGYFPGLKVDAFVILETEEGPGIDEFVEEVRGFSSSIPGCTSPEAIIMFGDSEADMKPILAKLGCAFSEQTIIAGNESCSFRHLSPSGSEIWRICAAALVFAREGSTSNGQGKIEFHFAVGTGVSAVGPIYRVVSAKRRARDFSTWLTAKREGENAILDGQQMLHNLQEELVEPIPSYDLYIGVNKRRKYAIGSEKAKIVRSFTFHPVKEADEQYLYVGGLDIKTGDAFSFVAPVIEEGTETCAIISENFAKLKHKEMIGGFIFACCGRGESFFGKPNVDSSPILDNFPDIPIGGMFCGGEIGRGSPNLGRSDKFEEQDLIGTRSHVYSSIYLLVSYTPTRS